MLTGESSRKELRRDFGKKNTQKMGWGPRPSLPKWASKPCVMGIDEAGVGPLLGPMVYGCLYCPLSYQQTLATLSFADSKTLNPAKRKALFNKLKVDESIGWDVDVIDPRELSDKLLNKRNKTNLIEISHDSAIGLINKVLNMGVLLKWVYLDTVGDPEEFKLMLCGRFPNINFVVAAKADSLYPVVSGASIVAKVTRDNALRKWVLDETAEGVHTNFGSGYPIDPRTKAWLKDHKHSLFGFPTLVRLSSATLKSHSKDFVPVVWESDGRSIKRLKKVMKVRKFVDMESSGKGRCRFFEARKLEPLRQF